MTISQLYRISGLGILIGAVAFVVHVVLRSLTTAGLDPPTFAKQGLRVPINALGAVGAALVLLGLRAMYARIASPTGLLGLVGVVLIAVAWMFFGMFLSLYGRAPVAVVGCQGTLARRRLCIPPCGDGL
jgi:hypothetical protein